ncbi:hypothetical protein ACEPAF_6245 [Sanghuangporus sanghuang]
MQKAPLPSPTLGHGRQKASMASLEPSPRDSESREASASPVVPVNNGQESHINSTYIRGLRWKSHQHGSQVVPATVAPAGIPDVGFAVFTASCPSNSPIPTLRPRGKHRIALKATPHVPVDTARFIAPSSPIASNASSSFPPVPVEERVVLGMNDSTSSGFLPEADQDSPSSDYCARKTILPSTELYGTGSHLSMSLASQMNPPDVVVRPEDVFYRDTEQGAVEFDPQEEAIWNEWIDDSLFKQ